MGSDRVGYMTNIDSVQMFVVTGPLHKDLLQRKIIYICIFLKYTKAVFTLGKLMHINLVYNVSVITMQI